MQAVRIEQQGPSGGEWALVLDMQVLDEIRRLERLKPRLMQLDDGRDPLGAVNAQLRVLQERLDAKQVVKIWGEVEECLNPTWYHAQEAAAASRWLLRTGERCRMKLPSQGWEPFLIERRKAR